MSENKCNSKHGRDYVVSCSLTNHSKNLRGETVHSASSGGGIRFTWHENDPDAFKE